MKKLFALAVMSLLTMPLAAQDPNTAPAAANSAAPAAGTAAAAPAAPKAAGGEDGIKASFDKFSQAWNAGDAKARAACFTNDATLINPFGVAANGHAEIVKLFEQENMTIAKGTTHTFDNFKIHFVMPNFALVDCDGTISGAKDPSGQAMPDMKVHVYAVAVNRSKSKGWQLFAARPTIYAPMPGSAPAAAAASTGDAAAPAKDAAK